MPWPVPGFLPSAPSQSRVPALYAVSILTCLLAGTFVGTRLYVNIKFKLPLGRDFWMILVAGVFTWTAGGLGIWGGSLGLGRHSGDVPILNNGLLHNVSFVCSEVQGLQKQNDKPRCHESPDFYRNGDYQFHMLTRWFYQVAIALPTMTHVAAMFAQNSILFFYLKRLSMSHCHRVTTYMIGLVAALFCLVRVVGNTYHCSPNPEVAAGMCVKIHSLWYGLGVIIMALDLVIWSLPIPPLLRCAAGGKMPWGICIGVIATLAVGLLACIATIGRIVALKAMVNNVSDLSWHASLVFMFDQLEVGMGIVAACMPSFRRLLGLKSFSDDQPRHEVLPGELALQKESGSDLKDMWMRETIPAPPPRRIGGAIHIGPRGHLDLDIEGLGVLDSRLSGTICDSWRQQNIEMNDMDTTGTTIESKTGVTTHHYETTGPNTSTSAPIQITEREFDDGEITPDNRCFSFQRRGTGGSSVISQHSVSEVEKYFPGSLGSKTPLTSRMSEEVLVPSNADDHIRRDRDSDRNIASR